MSNTNDFLPFCANFTGTNLPTQSAYVSDPNRPIGNQPGIASSKFNNKPLRQATYVASLFAQYVSNQANVSVFDDATPNEFLSQITGALMPLAPSISQFLTGSGTWNATVYFFCAPANATAGATYTNNSVTYTVVSTISAGTILQTTGNGAPTSGSGGATLTKATGTGDATITFYAFRAPIALRVHMVGGGGGGGAPGTGSPGNAGTDGADTTFGTSFLTAGHGFAGAVFSGGAVGGAGGTNTINPGGVTILNIPGGSGTGVQEATDGNGSPGGASYFGGAGGGGHGDASAGGGGFNAAANSGSGGGSGGATTAANAASGGAGGYIELLVSNPAFSYAYVVGAGGAGGTNGAGGGAGGSGQIIVEAMFQ